MIYEVSLFGHYRTNGGDILPGWLRHYIGAASPEEAKAKALPIMDAHPSFTAGDPAVDPVEVRIAKCRSHPRYQAKRRPTGTCGACHAIYDAAQKWSKEVQT